jgi:putative flippase GtrA
MDSKKRNPLNEYVLFNIIGAINTLLGLVIYFSLIYTGVNYIAALIVDYIFGIVFSFILNKTYTFRMYTKVTRVMLFKMLSVYGLVFCLNLILLTIMVEFYLINIYLSQIISCGILSAFTFYSQKYFVFRSISIYFTK